MWETLLGALLIFGLRIGDVSVGTLRAIYMVRGDRLRAAPLAFLESGIWLMSISLIMKQLSNMNVLNMVAYAGGFATGTVCGITLDRWIGSGWVVVRIITDAKETALAAAIRAAGFGLTVLSGEGRAGEQSVLFIVARRRRGKELLQLIERTDPDAFVTVDAITHAMGGYLPVTPGGASLKK